MGNKRINLRLSEEDYNKIKANSKELGMTMNAFITKSAVNPAIIQYDYRALRDCIDAIGKVKNELYWVLASNKLVYPDDIQAVLGCIQNLNDTLNAMLKHTRRERKALEEALKKGKYDYLLLRKDNKNV